MSIAVRVEPLHGTPSDVEYRWDTDTDILTANLRARAVGEGASGSVEIEGSDGSWLILDLNGGSMHGVEVAVWPEVRKRSSLAPPSEVTDGRVMVGGTDNGIAADRDEHGAGSRRGRLRADDSFPTRSVASDEDGAHRARHSDRRRRQGSHRGRVAPRRSPISGRPVITTIVLIKADPKRIPEAAMKLAGIDGVQEVYSVSGEWDLVAIVKVAEYEQIAQVVTERFPEVAAIQRTQTLTAFRAYSKKDLEQAWDIGVE